MNILLTSVCLFTVFAATWLTAMENLLQRPGYVGRSVVDILLVIQALATIVICIRTRPAILRVLVLVGAVIICWVGVSAVYKILNAPHFEGFVLVIAIALIIEGILTLAALSRSLRSHQLA